MFASARNDAEHLLAVRQLKDWTRSRFGLDQAAVVMAAQVICGISGCPPIETIVAFWSESGTRYRFKVFKPVVEVVYDDLPYAWLLPSLVDDGGPGFECC